jgi:transposase
MDTQAIVAVTLQPADRGDTTSISDTVESAVCNLMDVQDDPATKDTVHEVAMDEVVADKGYHSNATMTELEAMKIRSYVSEPDRGQRDWEGQPDARRAVYANRRRIRGKRGKGLMRKRGELIERSFAHCYETGGMRRTHLRGHGNILKRLLVHVVGFNLGLVMRSLFGFGKPRRAQDGLADALLRFLGAVTSWLGAFWRSWSLCAFPKLAVVQFPASVGGVSIDWETRTSSTGC